MSLASALAVYFIVWWIALFAVLPWGIRSQADEGEVVPGSEPGAPARAPLLRIVIVNTLVSAVIFAGIWWLVANGMIGLQPRA